MRRDNKRPRMEEVVWCKELAARDMSRKRGPSHMFLTMAFGSDFPSHLSTFGS